MVITIYALIVLASVAQSVTVKLFDRDCPHSTAFNAIRSCTAFLLFAIAAAFDFTFHMPTVIFGLMYGASLCLSMYAGYKALCHGPMALTSMLVSFSVIIPLIWGITVGNETLKLIQYPALVLLLAAIVFTNTDKFRTKSNEGGEKRYGIWLLFVGVTFLCNGICSVLQKQHQTLYPESYSKEFMLFATLLCSIVFSIAALKKVSFKELRTLKGKHFGVLSGLANGLANFLTLILAGLENASVLFPIISAGTIFVSLICGRLIFRDKLKVNHFAALAAGMAAVVLLKL